MAKSTAVSGTVPGANSNARLASLEALRETILPAYWNPLPKSDATLRRWFDENRIPRFKRNPSAKRGGGPVMYCVSAIEKLLKNSMLPGRIQPMTGGVK